MGSAATAGAPGLPWSERSIHRIAVEASLVAEIEAVVLSAKWSPSGVGGTVVANYRPAVLYRDGSYTTDGERALARGAQIDGRWQREGRGYRLTEATKGRTTHIEAKMRGRPAEPGLTLTGNYRNLAGAGLANSGVPMVTAFKSFEFAGDGTVRMGSGGGASSDDVVAHGKKSTAARYRLDGWTITLTYPDGRIEQRLFYFFPDSNRAIGVGGSTLTARR